MRFSVEASKVLESLEPEIQTEVKEYLNKRELLLVSKEDVEGALKVIAKPKVEVIRSPEYKPKAREYDEDIIVDKKRDVTGKSKTKGTSADFVRYFQNRFKRISSLFGAQASGYVRVKLSDIKSAENEKVCVVVMVKDKRESKNGNLILDVEDETSYSIAVINKNSSISDKAKIVINDDIIRLYCKVKNKLLLVEDIEFPDIKDRPVPPTVEKEVAIAYISDLHFGSNTCMENLLEKFLKILKSPKHHKELVGKIKYIIVAGDLVDGIGIYPGQEKELTVKDIFSQYELFDRFLQEVPDYIEVIVAPGNHDAVRRGEPMPQLKESFFTSAKPILIGNPGHVIVEGYRHLIYHGTSMDSLVSNIPGLSYTKVEPIMREYLRRRHLSPIYGTNPIIPEEMDYMVMDVVPHVLHTGHIHRNGQALYKGVLMINSGTFQDQTAYQLKQGHVPTPGLVPIYELDKKKLTILDVKEEEA